MQDIPGIGTQCRHGRAHCAMPDGGCGFATTSALPPASEVLCDQIRSRILALGIKHAPCDSSQRERNQATAALQPVRPGAMGCLSAGQGVRDGIPGKLRAAGASAHHFGESRCHPGIVTVGDPVGTRLITPIAGDTDPGATTLLTQPVLHLHTELAQGSRTRGFDDHVRRRQQFTERPPPIAAGEIESNASLALIEQRVKFTVTETRTVGAVDGFHLDDSRAAQPQQMGAERTGPERGEIHHQRYSTPASQSAPESWLRLCGITVSTLPVATRHCDGEAKQAGTLQ